MKGNVFRRLDDHNRIRIEGDVINIRGDITIADLKELVDDLCELQSIMGASDPTREMAERLGLSVSSENSGHGLG